MWVCLVCNGIVVINESLVCWDFFFLGDFVMGVMYGIIYDGVMMWLVMSCGLVVVDCFVFFE